MGFGWRTYRPRIRSYGILSEGKAVPDKATYRLDELAGLWNISVKTLRRMIRGGTLKAFRVGRAWRVSDSERRRCEINGSVAASRGQ